MFRQEFEVRRTRSDGKLNHLFFKLLYTAALRLGLVLNSTGDCIKLQFEGGASEEIQPHKQNREAWQGTLTVRDRQTNGDHLEFENVVAIVERNDRGSYRLITFWPGSQNPDARDSYTDPLVDIAMSGNAPESFLEYVASVMHKEFISNPGMSPAVAMHELNQELVAVIQSSADQEIERWRTTTEKALDAHKEALAIADAYKDEAERSREEVEKLKVLLEQAVAKQNSESASPEGHAAVATAVTPKWNSLTGSTYSNVGISAHVVSVLKSGNYIVLTYIDRFGENKKIKDFARNGFVATVHDYLIARVGKSAVFIVTSKPKGDVMLASDTMMLEKYRKLWITK